MIFHNSILIAATQLMLLLEPLSINKLLYVVCPLTMRLVKCSTIRVNCSWSRHGVECRDCTSSMTAPHRVLCVMASNIYYTCISHLYLDETFNNLCMMTHSGLYPTRGAPDVKGYSFQITLYYISYIIHVVLYQLYSNSPSTTTKDIFDITISGIEYHI